MSNKKFRPDRDKIFLTLLYLLEDDNPGFNRQTSKYYIFRLKKRLEKDKAISNIFKDFHFKINPAGPVSQSLDETYSMFLFCKMIYTKPHDVFYDKFVLTSTGHDFVENYIKPHLKKQNEWKIYKKATNEIKKICNEEFDVLEELYCPLKTFKKF